MSANKSPERDRYLYIAKLCEQAERYNEMADALKSIAKLNVDLTFEERNLFSVGYGKLIGQSRTSWRVINAIGTKEKSLNNETNVEYASTILKKVVAEMMKVCNEVLEVIDQNLIPSTKSEESKVFFYKIKGDYQRYMCEVLTGDERKQMADSSLAAYNTATEIAKKTLPAIHPVRLGQTLNFAVFQYDVVGSTEKACEIAQAAYDEALAEIEELSDDSYRDTSLIVNLLRDNIRLWKEEPQHASS